MLSARLKHKIGFLKQVKNNALIPGNWEEQFSAFAEIIPIGERNYGYIENFNFGQLVIEELFVFRIRYTSNPLTGLRIKYSNRLFDIKKIINVNEKNLLLSIVAIEVKNA